MPGTDIREVVRERYGEIARAVRATGSSCCYDGELGVGRDFGQSLFRRRDRMVA